MAQRPTILVVDDEQVILDSARRTLAADRFDVTAVTDAESALPLLESAAPDILVTDLMLPGASGGDLLAAARALAAPPLVIITTGYSTVENAVDSLKSGAFDFLPKPFTFDELLSTVERACRALTLPPAARTADDGRGSDYLLGAQTWARLEVDGTALLGATEFTARTIERIEEIRLPDPDKELRQGGRLTTLTTADGLTHTLWSPLSGRVLLRNDHLRDAPDSLREDPRDRGWLVRVLAADVETELGHLTGPVGA